VSYDTKITTGPYAGYYATGPGGEPFEASGNLDHGAVRTFIWRTFTTAWDRIAWPLHHGDGDRSV
jgi:hypothetical protein